MLYQNLEIAPDELPAIEEVQFNRHPLRYRTLRLIDLFIVMTLLASAWVIPLLKDVRTAIWVGLAIAWGLIFLLFLIEEIKGFRIRGYALREHDITYQKGYFLYSLATIPFNRVQHSEISRGPIARLFRLTTLRIYTAGGATSDLSIGGLEPEEATRLRDHIAKSTSGHA